MDTGTIQLVTIATNQDNFSTPVVDAHRHELAVSTASSFLAKFCLPAIEPAFANLDFLAELPHCLSTLQELLVDGSEVIQCPHTIIRFCGQR